MTEAAARRFHVYAVAFGALLAAVALRWLLDPWLGGARPLVTLYAAIAAAAWVGGYRPAVAVAVLGYLASDWLFIEPRGQFDLDRAVNLIGLGAYALSAGAIILLAEALRRARREAEAARDRLATEAEGRRSAGHALRDSEQRLRLALEAGRMGTWEWHIPSGRVTWDDNLQRMHGYEPGTFPGTFEAYEREIHPADRDYVKRGVAATFEHGTDHHLEYRIVGADGQVRWVEGRGKLFRDERGRPERLIGICTDATERKRAEEALREADRRKDEFLATLAHELRNPLAPIRNAAQVMKLGGGGDARLAWCRDVIERQAAHMARLLDDLLDVSRITRNRLELRRSRIALGTVIDLAIETSRPMIESREHALAVALPDAPVFLDADPVRLAQVFSNLLNNAAKYTETGGRIRLSARREGDTAVVEVTDNGIGIPAAMLPRMFGMFAQAEDALVRSSGGLGIGLALSKALVEMHGGTIAVASDGPGTGCTFTVRLPALRVAAVVEQAPAVPGVVRDAASAAPTAAREETAAGTAITPPRRVLIVDDLRDGAESMALLLGGHGHDVRLAFDGEDGVAAAESFRPDVVLLDLGMPKVNGYEACRRIRAQAWGRDVRLVALTGWGQDDDRRRTRAAGFDAHLVKPVEPAELLAVVSAAPATADEPGRPMRQARWPATPASPARAPA